jgi:(p)ppGpp synthase/HD superfamily hydrolase
MAKSADISNRVTKAVALVTKAHEGQFRKDGKTPFITHPQTVLKLVQEYFPESDDVRLIAAFAHDCVEDVEDFDIETFVDEVYDDEPGYTVEKRKIIDLVLALTKNNTISGRHGKNLDNYERIAYEGEDAVRIKLCDRYHNVSDMEGMTNAFKLRYLSETHFLMGYFAGYKSTRIYQDLLKITEKRETELFNKLEG